MSSLFTLLFDPNRYFPDHIQNQRIRIAIPPPNELHPFHSYSRLRFFNLTQLTMELQTLSPDALLSALAPRVRAGFAPGSNRAKYDRFWRCGSAP